MSKKKRGPFFTWPRTRGSPPPCESSGSRVAKLLAGILGVLALLGGCTMPHGAPDWSIEAPMSTVHRVMDVGELAVRLGSAVTYDRRGNVVLVDSFGSGHPGWIRDGSGDGYQVVISTQAARTGAYSTKLVTGRGFGSLAGLTKYTPRPVPSKVGLEASFAPIDSHATIGLRLYEYTGAGYYLYHVRYVYPTGKLQFMDSAGAWQDLATDLAFWPNYTSFNPLKVVADFAENEWVRVLFNDGTYYLEDQPGYWVVGVTPPYVSLFVYAQGDDLGNYTVYVDDVILTQNEP